jgi:Phosphotransferase enzyme family
MLTTPPPDQLLDQLRTQLSHPWIAERAGELDAWLHRFDEVLARARSAPVSDVLSHDDLDGANVLIGSDGQIVAALDWDWARLGPREYDLWTVVDHTHPRRFLVSYGIDQLDLDPTHLELGLIRRALGDLAARVVQQVDRPGVTTWGFQRLVRIDQILALFREPRRSVSYSPNAPAECSPSTVASS